MLPIQRSTPAEGSVGGVGGDPRLPSRRRLDAGLGPSGCPGMTAATLAWPSTPLLERHLGEAPELAYTGRLPDRPTATSAMRLGHYTISLRPPTARATPAKHSNRDLDRRQRRTPPRPLFADPRRDHAPRPRPADRHGRRRAALPPRPPRLPLRPACAGRDDPNPMHFPATAQ
jgi:hypothetical protein